MGENPQEEISPLYLKILEGAIEWRKQGYPCEQYPAIKHILHYNFTKDRGYTFLRPPQFQALEIYWYLRLKHNTPHFLDLYKIFYSDQIDCLKALGINLQSEEVMRLAMNNKLFDAIKTDKEFVEKQKLQTVYESLTLQYPSYILALTMGAGKTILIASIIATEFTMSMEYQNDDYFMKNALVFAPDKTIIDSLREISDTPFDKILPPGDYQLFMANMKLIYAQDNVKDIAGLQEKSNYNIIITNTQKIIPKKANKTKKQTYIEFEEKARENEYNINLRLQKISSLPCIGIFSDEAHHTFGNKIGDELKRVREAINYIDKETDIKCVINTTGTPYSKKQILKEVVYWYGLDQGIKDNILKSLHDSIIAYDFSSLDEQTVIDNIITDFFAEYGEHTLPNGAKAKIAFYFNNKQHLEEGKAVIESALAKINISPSLILKNTEDATTQELNEFKTLNSPANENRIILLIQKGTEGWNCPSLFATALIRKLSSSNNAVLQASTRCLRQVVGNDKPARIYIESANQRILDKELEENFKLNLSQLKNNAQDYDTHIVKIKKPNPPRLEIIREEQEKKVIHNNRQNIILELPQDSDANSSIYKTTYELNLSNTAEILHRTGQIEKIEVTDHYFDIFTATNKIAECYHLPYSLIYHQLKKLYPDHNIPKHHIVLLCKQIDNLQNEFEISYTTITEALAIIKVKDSAGNDIFDKDEDGVYCHTIRYKKNTPTHILDEDKIPDNSHNFGFHYAPYHFDSNTEKEFFNEICKSLNSQPEEIQDIYFTGGLTDEKYTDFFFEYKDVEGVFRKYYPDFVVVKKSGEFIIVEVKASNKEQNQDKDIELKEKAVQQIQNINGNQFKYHILYTDTPIPTNKLHEIETLIYG